MEKKKRNLQIIVVLSNGDVIQEHFAEEKHIEKVENMLLFNHEVEFIYFDKVGCYINKAHIRQFQIKKN